MPTTMNIPDEADIIARNEQLRLESRHLRAKIQAEGKSAPAEPGLSIGTVMTKVCQFVKGQAQTVSVPQTVECEDVLAENEALERHVENLKAIDATPKPPKAPVTVPQTNATGRNTPSHGNSICAENAAKMTLTDKCRAARSGKSLPDTTRKGTLTERCLAAKANARTK